MMFVLTWLFRWLRITISASHYLETAFRLRGASDSKEDVTIRHLWPFKGFLSQSFGYFDSKMWPFHEKFLHLILLQVFTGSPASGDLQRGDVITSIQHRDASFLLHQEANDLIRNSGGSIQLGIRRFELHSVYELTIQIDYDERNGIFGIIFQDLKMHTRTLPLMHVPQVLHHTDRAIRRRTLSAATNDPTIWMLFMRQLICTTLKILYQ